MSAGPTAERYRFRVEAVVSADVRPAPPFDSKGEPPVMGPASKAEASSRPTHVNCFRRRAILVRIAPPAPPRMESRSQTGPDEAPAPREEEHSVPPIGAVLLLDDGRYLPYGRATGKRNCSPVGSGLGGSTRA